jgi:hypothetical protein
VRPKGAVRAAAGLAFTAAALCSSIVPAGARGGTYVALGDSYTSGPLIQPTAPGSPVLCLQSAANYPHLTAQALGLSLTDVSCAAATVSNMTQSQYPGVSPQFDALSADDSLVTLGIGGNDNNTFITAVAGCGIIDITDPENLGAPCEAAFGDRFADAIASDAPNIAAALRQIHALAPDARVLVVGYPDILPQQGNCWPQMPLTSDDVAYLNGMEQDLNSMLRQQAEAAGDTFVDTYTASIGHDACQPESNRWVEPVVPSTDAISVHPNAAGEAQTAKAVEAAAGQG